MGESFCNNRSVLVGATKIDDVALAPGVRHSR
jgi:hypothetical protein